MARRFDADSTHGTRAQQIWLILIGKAHNRQTLTYGQLADLIGFHGSGTLGAILGHISGYCRENALPPLNVLVINQSTGQPGDGYPDKQATLDEDRESVFHQDWYALFPPSVTELRAAYREHFCR